LPQTFSVELLTIAAQIERAAPVPELAAALAAFEQGCWQARRHGPDERSEQ
jgi:hypothetical protein